MSGWIDVLPQALAAAGGLAGIGSLAKAVHDVRTNRARASRIDADASRIVADTAVGLLQPLREEAEELRSEIHSMRVYVQQLTRLLRSAHIPIPDPPLLATARAEKNARRTVKNGRTTD